MNADILAKWREMVVSYAEGRLRVLPTAVQIFLTSQYRDTFGKLPRQCRCANALRDAAVELATMWRKNERSNGAQG